MLFRMTFRISN